VFRAALFIKFIVVTELFAFCCYYRRLHLPSAALVCPCWFHIVCSVRFVRSSVVAFYTAAPLYTAVRSSPFVHRFYLPVFVFRSVRLVILLYRLRLLLPSRTFCHVRVRKRILISGVVFYCRCYRTWVLFS